MSVEGFIQFSNLSFAVESRVGSLDFHLSFCSSDWLIRSRAPDCFDPGMNTKSATDHGTGMKNYVCKLSNENEIASKLIIRPKKDFVQNAGAA